LSRSRLRHPGCLRCPPHQVRQQRWRLSVPRPRLAKWPHPSGRPARTSERPFAVTPRSCCQRSRSFALCSGDSPRRCSTRHSPPKRLRHDWSAHQQRRSQRNPSAVTGWPPPHRESANRTASRRAVHTAGRSPGTSQLSHQLTILGAASRGLLQQFGAVVTRAPAPRHRPPTASIQARRTAPTHRSARRHPARPPRGRAEAPID
jgi:hypothetical protein